MRCLNCKYDLRKLSEHRCPECGREFDPDDMNTFAAGPIPSPWIVVFVNGVIAFLVLGVIAAAIILANAAFEFFPM